MKLLNIKALSGQATSWPELGQDEKVCLMG